MNVCVHLSNENSVEFKVEGFGLEWPVDVMTDLSTVIPQIEGVVNSLRNSDKASIQFYEQGIEKELEFLRVDENVLIKCKDLISNETFGVSEERSFNSVDRMLVNFLVSFIRWAKQRLPALCNNTFFKELSSSASRLVV